MPLRALSFALAGLLGAPTASTAAPVTPAAATLEARDPALVRLRELFTSTDGRLAAPKSPRFASLCEPALRGTRFVIGWLLPELSDADVERALALVAALGRAADGRLDAELPPAGGKVTSTAAIDDVGGAKLLVITVASPRRGVEKELELGVLALVARLGAEGNAPFAGLVRRALSPVSRVVVEVYPPEPARPSARPPKPAGSSLPKLYVVKSGDTLAKVAKHFNISEKALSDVNRIELQGPLSPGQKLVLPR